MIAGTHVALASALYLSGTALFEYETDPVGWAIACAASLLPDADLPTSKLGRALFWLSTRLKKRFGHRTITHSIIAIVALALLSSPLWDNRRQTRGGPGEDQGRTRGQTTIFMLNIAVCAYYSSDASFKELCRLYGGDDRLRVPATVFNAVLNRREAV